MISKAIRINVLLIVLLTFSFSLNAQTTVTIGDPNTTTVSEKYPFNDYYNYSWSNVIYLQSEIGQGGQITHIAFNIYNNSTVSMASQKIYIRHTTATGYTSSTYPGTTGYTLVYDGTIAYSGAGWKTITLTTPFAYNGTDNLEILYENRNGTWSSNFPYFYATSGYSSNRVRRDFSDASFPSSCVNCGAFANLPNTRLTISCATPLSITPATPAICNGSNTTLTASGASTYTWSPATGLNTTTSATVTASPTVTTTYTLTGVDGSSCTQTKTVTVTVNPLPTVSISPTSASICNGSNTTLTASGASTYTWSPATGLSATTGASVTANPTVTTTYTITGTNANGCTNTSTVQVTVNTTPTVSVNPTSATVCNGNNATLTASGATSYTWSPATGLNTTTGATVIATPTVATTYTVTGTSNGCSATATAAISIGEVNAGMAIASGGTDICSNTAVSLSLESKKASLAAANGTLTTEKYPFNGYYNYGWSDVIYPQSELGSAGTITALAFYVDNAPANFVMDNQTIYIKTTTATGFSNSDYPGTTGFTQVYNGSITYNGSGWKTINLSTTFTYDGTSNLEILYVNNDGSYALSGFPLFRYASGYATNRVKRDYADGSFPSTCLNCGTFANVPSTQIIIDRPLGTFVKWQSSTDNINYADLTGGTTQNYNTSVNTSTYFRAQVTSATCGTAYSDVAYYTTSNNYYVNDNATTGDVYTTAVGSSSNDGRSPSSPKASINSIITTYVLGPCDTIFVDNGNYTEGITMLSSDGGNAQHYTVIHGAGIDKTVFTAAASTNNFYFNQTSYVKVEGFTLNSSQSNLSNVYFNGATNNIIDNNKINHTVSTNIDVYGTTVHSNKNQISNNKIYNSSTLGYGVLIRTNSDSTIVSGDSITMSVAGSKAAILAITDKVGNDTYYPHAATINGNTISAYTYGVALYGVDYPISAFTISNNKITLQSNTTTDGASLWMTNVSATSSVRTTIYNNKFIGGKHGIYMGVTANYSKIYNNYFSNNNYGLYIASSTSNNGELYFNSFYNSTSNTFFTTTAAASWTLKNNIFYTTSNVSTDANISAGSTTTFAACNYNLYYAPNGAAIANFGGTAYTTLSAWQGVAHSTETPNGDQNSVTGDPEYTNATSNVLDISQASLPTGKGLAISGITTDIDNGTRASSPSIGAKEASASTLYFRSAQTGNWNQISTWQSSVDNTTWTAASILPSYNQKTITIQSTHTVTITASTTIDETVVEGTLVYGNNTGSTITINNGTGTDLIINGTYQDIGPNSNVWSAAGASWSMGANGTLLRTRSTSSNNWRDHYEGGISTIPATANWILRKTGTDNPIISTIGGMHYPNLTIENTSGASWTTSGSSTFTGASDYPRIKGTFNIGGTGTNPVVFVNQNTNATLIPVGGDLIVQTGSTLQNDGTGFSVQGNINVLGNFTGTKNISFNGSGNQTLSGSAFATVTALTVNKPSGTLTLATPVTVKNTLTLTKGNIITSDANLLTVDSSGVVVGGDSTSFVSGPMKKIGKTAFTFPTGKGTNYQPISISAPTNATDAFKAEYFPTPQTMGNNSDTTIGVGATCEHWDLNPVVGNSQVYITAGWNANSCNVDSIQNMTVAYWDGTMWKDAGGANASGNRTAGNVSAAARVGGPEVGIPVRPIIVLPRCFGTWISALLSTTVTHASGTIICSGASQVLSASSTNPAFSLSWWSADLSTQYSNTGTYTASPTITTLYKVEIKHTNNCKLRLPVTIVVNSLPTVVSTSTTVCAGASATITASGADSYSWNTIPVTTTATLTINPATTTVSYTVTGTSTVTTCSNTAVGTITVNPLPNVSATSITVCNGQSAAIIASGADDYSWNTIPATTTATLTINPATVTTTYTVIGTNTATTCSNTSTGTITVTAMMVNAGADQTIQQGGSATLNGTASSGTSPYSYSWMPVTGLSNPTVANPVSNATVTTIYTLTVTDANNCIGTDNVTIFTEFTQFAVLKKKVNAGFFVTSNNKLYFKFDEEYINGAGLNYVVYNENHSPVVGTTLKNLATNTNVWKYGDNRFELDIATIPIGQYVLEINNEKNEKFYLKFKK